MIRKSLDEIKRTAIDVDELAHLQEMSDDEIDYDDIPPLTEQQIANLR